MKRNRLLTPTIFCLITLLLIVQVANADTIIPLFDNRLDSPPWSIMMVPNSPGNHINNINVDLLYLSTGRTLRESAFLEAPTLPEINGNQWAVGPLAESPGELVGPTVDIINSLFTMDFSADEWEFGNLNEILNNLGFAEEDEDIDYHTVYARINIKSHHTENIEAALNVAVHGNTSAKCWLNGSEVPQHTYATNNEIGASSTSITLVPGDNDLLLKSSHALGEWNVLPFLFVGDDKLAAEIEPVPIQAGGTTPIGSPTSVAAKSLLEELIGLDDPFAAVAGVAPPFDILDAADATTLRQNWEDIAKDREPYSERLDVNRDRYVNKRDLQLVEFALTLDFDAICPPPASSSSTYSPYCPKVHVIWYYAANEQRRKEKRAPLFGEETDYITPNNVADHLEDVQNFFKKEVEATFEFVTAPGNIVVTYIKSNNFFVSNPKNVTTGAQYNPKTHFKDDQGTPEKFLDNVWNDIKSNHLKNLPDPLKDIYLVLVQSKHGYLGSTTTVGKTITGSRGRVDTIGGHIAMVALGDFSEDWNNERITIVIAHELGHAFGLFHDFSEEGRIMGYNWEEAGLETGFGPRHDRLFSNWFSERSKNWLKVHPAFNDYFISRNVDKPIEIKVQDASQPSHHPKILPSLGSVWPNNSGPVGKINVSANTSSGKYEIHLDITDLDKLHQVELIAPSFKDSVGCPEGGCDSDNFSLARYLYAGSSDPGVSGNFSSMYTTWRGTFDITAWMEQVPDTDPLETYIATTDKLGNKLYFHLQIEPTASTAPAPFVQKHLPKKLRCYQTSQTRSTQKHGYPISWRPLPTLH